MVVTSPWDAITDAEHLEGNEHGERCEKEVPPMGTMGVPPSVFMSMPDLVSTSNSGLRLMKNSGLPQPARMCTGLFCVHSCLL